MFARLGIRGFVAFAMAIALPGWQTALADATPIRAAVLKYGTVNWELDTIRHHGLDRKHGIDLQLVELAGRDATAIALHSGDVDTIVTDWIWVARERSEDRDYTFIPFSKAVGALVVPAGSPVQDLGDLAGKRIGIAGGPLDKSWLMLRALAQKEEGIDLMRETEQIYGAPPLLNQQLLMGRLDAVVNFWHFVARLEAEGARRVLDVAEAGRRLGMESDVPLLGFVFRESWAEANRDAVLGLLEASREAKAILATSDAEWERIRPLMQAEDEATFLALRAGYREGIPTRWGAQEQTDAETVFAIMSELGGEELVGRSTALPPGTFWAPAMF